MMVIFQQKVAKKKYKSSVDGQAIYRACELTHKISGAGNIKWQDISLLSMEKLRDAGLTGTITWSSKFWNHKVTGNLCIAFHLKHSESYAKPHSCVHKNTE
jgi:hypothetical protein